MCRSFLTPLLSVILTIACSQADQHDSNTIIPAAVKDSVIFIIDDSSAAPVNNSYNINLYYHDTLGYGHPFTIFAGQTSILLDAPAFFLRADDNQTPYLVYPGERIHIRYSKNGNIRMYVKDNPGRSGELNFFPELIRQTDNLSYAFKAMPHLSARSAKDSIAIGEKVINRLLQQRMRMLQNEAPKFSSHFSVIAGNAIHSAAIYDSLVLYWNNRAILGNKELQKKIITLSNAVNQLGFQPFIYNTKPAGAYASALLTGNPHYPVNDSISVLNMYQAIATHLNGQRKDFLLTRLLLDAYNKAIPISSKTLQLYYSDCENEPYRTTVRSRLTEADALSLNKKNGNNLRAGDGKTIEDLYDVMARYKGQLVLIDFWASWCIPCRAEMPYAATLKEKYKDRPVSFLYISIDEDTENWLKAAAQEKLNKENSYLLLHRDNAPFAKQYDISSIPRYMLFGKDGKVLLADAPRPSDMELVRVIDRFLQ